MGIKNIEGLATNESLKAIMAGLDVSEKDCILSICGSGDQAFAMLEKAKRVTVVDRNKDQIEYFKRRAGKLYHGFFELFLDTGKIPTDWIDEECLSSRDEYFSKQKLENIRKNLMNQKAKREIVGNIFLLNPKKGRFNKVYLSNSLDYVNFDPNLYSVRERLQKISDNLTNEGLIYVTKWDIFEEQSRIKNYPLLYNAGLRINVELTRKARTLQGKEGYYSAIWSPAVLQKTRE